MAWAGVPAWMWLAGGAVLSAGSAVAFWQVGEARYEDLRRECASGCTQAEKEASGVRTWDVLTNVSLGLSAALVAGSVAVLVLGSEREKPSPEVSVGVAPGGLQLRGHF